MRAKSIKYNGLFFFYAPFDQTGFAIFCFYFTTRPIKIFICQASRANLCKCRLKCYKMDHTVYSIWFLLSRKNIIKLNSKRDTIEQRDIDCFHLSNRFLRYPVSTVRRAGVVERPPSPPPVFISSPVSRKNPVT